MLTSLESSISPFDVTTPDGAHWTGLLELFQVFHRWQAAFNPSQATVQEFFGRPARGLYNLERDFPPHRYVVLQQALPACLPGWRQGAAVGVWSKECGEEPLNNILVPSGPGTWATVLDDAWVGYVSPTGEQVMTRLILHAYGYARLHLIATPEQGPFLRDLLERIETWIKAHPHLRGAKLDARGEFLRLDRVYTWEDIILGETTRAEVDTHIRKFLERLPRYQAYGLSAKRGVLLVGPPGTGKTLLGKVLCCTLPATFIWVSPGTVGCPYDFERLFALARESQPTIVFFEDLDLYAGRRDVEDRVLLGELLNQLDGFTNNQGILTVATTNDLKAIEPALADRPSRFDRIIRLDPPQPPERLQLFERFLGTFPYPPDCLPELVAATATLSGAHLQEVVQLAVQFALDAQPDTESEPPRLTSGHLRDAVRAVREQRTNTPGFYA